MNACLIGYGYWGKIIHKYLLNNKDINLVGIYSPHYENSVSLKLLLSQNIDCAFICTPIDTHYEIVKLFLQKKINVFCEKPLCKNFEQALELVSIAKKNNVILFTDYIYAYSPSINFIKNSIGRLGNVKYLDMEISQFGNFYQDDNVFEVLAVHLLSIISFWFERNLGSIEKVISMIKDENKKTLAGMLLVNISQTSRALIKCSLLSNQKTRKIILYCENGVMIFDMLSKETVSILDYQKNGSVHEIINKENYKFDETNNLKIVIEDYINIINSHSKNDKNLDITLKVSKYLDEIKFLEEK